MREADKRVAVITVSDSAYDGSREDMAGPALTEQLIAAGFVVMGHTVVPDEREDIGQTLRELVELDAPLVVTTGGTGLGPRDVTPEATHDVIERVVPGVAEAMRRAGEQSTPYAILSRGVCGAAARTLILNLPGSPHGAIDSLAAVLPVLTHAIEVLRSERHDHGGGFPTRDPDLLV